MRKTKIFYIGLSRTGTSSLHHILSELGLRSVHACSFLLSDPPNYKRCEDYECLGDTPVPLLYKELDKRFEGSKFILTIREKEQWLESMKWMFATEKWFFTGESVHTTTTGAFTELDHTINKF